MDTYNETEMTIIPRFEEGAGTCYGKNFKTAAFGFFKQFQDSFFYANVIQFLIVTLMYFNIGKGKYWKVLFYASVAGILGGILENITVAYICQDSQKEKDYIVIPFLIDELFWTTCEYAIPYLNLIKMKAFSKGKAANIIYYTIIGLFIPFACCRFCIGYERMKNGYLQSEKIKSLHGYAFGIMAIADILCTVAILYFVKKHNSRKNFNTSNISDYIKQSSYTILVAVDVVGFCLSILDIITNSGLIENYIPSSITTPFHCIKSSFILILAADALLFKYGANTNSSNASYANSSKYHTTTGGGGGGNSNSYGGNDHYYYKSGNSNTVTTKNSEAYKANLISYMTDMNNNTSQNPNNMLINCNFSNYSNPTVSNSKSIIKNYMNIKTSPTSGYTTSPSDITLSPQFGFLTQQ
ncbi:hypothetical protein BCR32DRAFT_299553 [Anaeromyces robustus]|uniref:Uncharacterized protein n=1 Tax=Anaeromyces robustus TaxID=1754192 RepID=A0A1Y1X7D8_9FUNG|nr:hypothetical protein BCR32DRAFT_299553 [Anaeromyces robustus]|eukprot:ORX81296.1 hypothetical protein BCR32DRAFT_299553 [Anaeromyces robustus]